MPNDQGPLHQQGQLVALLGIYHTLLAQVFALLAQVLRQLEARVPIDLTIRTRRLTPFDLSELTEADSWKMFRFDKAAVIRVSTALLPPWLTMDNRVRVDRIEAMCIVLYRLAFPTRLWTMEKVFPRDQTALSRIFNTTIQEIWRMHGHHLHFLPDQLTPMALRILCQSAEGRDMPLPNAFGFVDGTFRYLCRPVETQQYWYSGHKHAHGYKFQAVVIANGLFLDLSEAHLGSTHDSRIWAMSGIAERASALPRSPEGHPYVLFGDSGYGRSPALETPFRRTQRGTVEAQFNLSTSRARIAVEWGFGIVSNNWAGLELWDQLRVGSSPVGTYYSVAVLLTNLHNCLYPNEISQLFRLAPPSLEEYLAGIRVANTFHVE